MADSPREDARDGIAPQRRAKCGPLSQPRSVSAAGVVSRSRAHRVRECPHLFELLDVELLQVLICPRAHDEIELQPAYTHTHTRDMSEDTATSKAAA